MTDSKVTQGHRKCHGSTDFLLPVHSNYDLSLYLYRFPYISRYWSKIAIQCTRRGDPIGISQRCL